MKAWSEGRGGWLRSSCLDSELTLLIPNRGQVHVDFPDHDIPFEKVRVLHHRNANIFLQQLHQSRSELECEVLQEGFSINLTAFLTTHTLAYLVKERTIWMIKNFSLFCVTIEIDQHEGIRIQST